ncbi:MAG: WYL domain-containing protein [Eubacteriales bacterium]|nr:WYL domain-containing protein [Eubacteriales bacterium]
MAKSHNQKAKILYLEHMLRETGENRVVTMQEILTKLMECGIRAERKSIYDDIEALRDFGMDVRYRRGRPGGYYLAGQKAVLSQEEPAEPDEKKAVLLQEESAKPDEKKAVLLQEKSQGPEDNKLSDIAEAGRMPEPAAEDIPESSSKDSPVSERGREEEDKPKEVICGWQFPKDNPLQNKKTMKLLCYDAKEQQVRAYFGGSAEYKKKGLGYITVTAPLLTGPEFYGWLTAMGKDVHILKPRKAAAAYRDYLKALAKEYKGI